MALDERGPQDFQCRPKRSQANHGHFSRKKISWSADPWSTQTYLEALVGERESSQASLARQRTPRRKAQISSGRTLWHPWHPCKSPGRYGRPGGNPGHPWTSNASDHQGGEDQIERENSLASSARQSGPEEEILSSSLASPQASARQGPRRKGMATRIKPQDDLSLLVMVYGTSRSHRRFPSRSHGGRVSEMEVLSIQTSMAFITNFQPIKTADTKDANGRTFYIM